MAPNHGYTDEELDAADAEMGAVDEHVMFVGGHLAADEMPGAILLSAEEYERVLGILESPPRPTAALVALMRRLPAMPAREER